MPRNRKQKLLRGQISSEDETRHSVGGRNAPTDTGHGAQHPVMDESSSLEEGEEEEEEARPLTRPSARDSDDPVDYGAEDDQQESQGDGSSSHNSEVSEQASDADESSQHPTFEVVEESTNEYPATGRRERARFGNVDNVQALYLEQSRQLKASQERENSSWNVWNAWSVPETML